MPPTLPSQRELVATDSSAVEDHTDELISSNYIDSDTTEAEVESSRTSLASSTHFEVLGLGLEGQVLGLEASSPRKLACPRLEDSTIF